MSDSKPPEDQKPEDQAPADSAADSDGWDRAEQDDEPGDDQFDLDDLERLGVDGLAASLHTASPRRRHPVVFGVVLLACAPLLVMMFADFRFWLTSSQPTDIGDVSALLDGQGQLRGGYLNRYVTVRGTPDVQWATVMSTKQRGKRTYLRVREAGGRVFASMPRIEKTSSTATYSSVWTGRVSRFGDDAAFAWLDQLFHDEQVTQPLDATPQALQAALANGGTGLKVQTELGHSVLGPDDLVRLVLHTPDARVQLGKRSFRSDAEADAAMTALGYPFMRAGTDSVAFYRYVARIPKDRRQAAEIQLETRVEGSINPSNPGEGALVTSLRATFFAKSEALAFEDGHFVFPLADNLTSPGHDVRDGALVERRLEGGMMRVAASELSSVRLELSIVLDPNGYLIEVGVDPGSKRQWGILWLVVLGVAALNGFGLAMALRSRS